MPRTPAVRACLAVAFLTAATLSAGALAEEDQRSAEAPRVAAGYVADRACASCHREIYDSYQQVGMARSFFRPRRDRAIEDFDAEPYYHPASRTFYRLRWEGERLVFARFQRDPDGAEVNSFEREVDWVLGSGHRSRTYLYQAPSGELFQLPLAWYTEAARWAMAPGYDRADHQGVTRRVRRECMFCHNAYPEATDGSDHVWQPQVFPRQLPEGTGCQRCHGPGAEHVRIALGGDQLLAAPLTASIINPGRLAPERRDSVCSGCHLQPSVALFGVRRFERGDYSFRPGQALDDYMVRVDVIDERLSRRDRFEINHHPYRLRQSRCFEVAGSELNCLTCHDPHRKLAPPDRAAHYRAACLGCHQTLDPAAHGREVGAGEGAAEAGDCVACHMPRRRTQDVVEVVMTDHRIARGPFGPELLAPRAEVDPGIVAVELVAPESVPEPGLGDVYRGVAAVRAVRNQWSVDFLERAMAAAAPESPVPYLDLAGGQLTLRRYESAERNLRTVLDRLPDHPRAVEWLALVEASTERLDSALARLDRLLERQPRRPESHYNRGLVLRGLGRHEEALIAMSRAVELRPTFYHPRVQRGEILSELGRHPEAVEAFRDALAIDPRQARAYSGLARALETGGEDEAAARWLRHGIAVTSRPDPLERQLAELESAAARSGGR